MNYFSFLRNRLSPLHFQVFSNDHEGFYDLKQGFLTCDFCLIFKRCQTCMSFRYSLSTVSHINLLLAMRKKAVLSSDFLTQNLKLGSVNQQSWKWVFLGIFLITFFITEMRMKQMKMQLKVWIFTSILFNRHEFG